ncbi:MAG TPA: CocE/NonD family hydrolase [Galbitalea sp.]
MTTDGVIVERDVWIPMRDGVRLQADVWRPATPGRYPVLLQRTPYNRADSFAVIVNAGIEPLRAVSEGFVVVIQDTRGRFGSEGVFDPFKNEAADGFDTIEWLATQSYSNGRVGMYGASYYAATQLLAATANPPALRAIAPQATASDYHDDWTYRGGALQLGFTLYWALGLAGAEAQRRRAAGENVDALETELQKLSADPWAAYRARPLASLEALGALLPAWNDWLGHPARDDFWRSISIAEQFTHIDVPALHIGGWFDIFLHGTLANYRGLASRPDASQQRLVIGPWAHAVAYDALGEVEYGASASAAALDLTRLQLDWFAGFLKPNETRIASAPVRVFMMGENAWRDEDAWPPTRARKQLLYLGGSDVPDVRFTGELSGDFPEASQSATYTFNPNDPVPTTGGATFLPGAYVGLHSGQRDQSAVEQRADVLSYTTATLGHDLELCGPVSATVWASTSADDTDWTAKLVDVHPDGRALNVCDGIIRARYANGSEAEEFVPSGTVRAYRIDLGATAITIGSGHALRLEISSSNFPRFDVNPGYRGDVASATADDFVVATQQVFHGGAYPSHLELTVVGENQPRPSANTGVQHVTHR